MIILGRVRQHSEEFSFCWHLIMAVCTGSLWLSRNICIFQQQKHFPAKQEVEDCWFKIGYMLCSWPGKGRENARRIAFACKVMSCINQASS
eukprot:c18338_g1_i2 orf=33-305(-)